MSRRSKLRRFVAASDTRTRLIAAPLLILGLAIWILPTVTGVTSFWPRLLYIVIGGVLAGMTGGALFGTTRWAKNQRRRRRGEFDRDRPGQARR